MILDKTDTKKLFASLDETWDELLNLISSTNHSAINKVPFEDSWTAAQLVTHIIKSNNGIVQALQMSGKPSERNPEAGVPKLKKIFLDFDAKYQSPAFIVPEKKDYNKDEVSAALQKSIEHLKQKRNKIDFTEIINLPAFGDVTKLELLHFVLYHTRRHNYQLKNILKIVNGEL